MFSRQSSFQTNYTEVNPYDKISVNNEILIQGLVNNQKLNNTTAKIISFNKIKNRYNVKTEYGKIVALKPDNVKEIINFKVMGLKNQSNLNGKIGQIIGFDITSNRYRVIVNNSMISLKSKNIIIERDHCVKLQGIISQPHLNDKIVKVKSFDPALNKYTVQISESKLIKVKMENINF